MEQKISKQLKEFANTLPQPLYIVGGTCREYIMGQPFGGDFDLCSPMLAEEFCEYAKAFGFHIQNVYRHTGTVKLSGFGCSYEYSCFRSDEYVRGEHTPQKTFFTTDILLDARRRDFTCNAIYYHVQGNCFVDPLGGIEHLQKKEIHTVVSADKVFGEDGLRLMRLARFASTCGLRPTEECLSGAKKNSQLIQDIAVERVLAELDAILVGDQKYGVVDAPYQGLKILEQTEVLSYILPELWLGKGMSQRQDYHNHDVLEHSLRSVRYCVAPLRLCALLHDVGKPKCMLESGKFHFHEKVGADLAREIMKRLKVSKARTERYVRLIATHMYDLNLEARISRRRKFIIENYDLMEDIFAIKQADFSACKDCLDLAPFNVAYRQEIEKMKAEGVPFTVKELQVKGNELIDAGIPKQKISEVLHNLLLACAFGDCKNIKEKLIYRAKKLNQ